MKCQKPTRISKHKWECSNRERDYIHCSLFQPGCLMPCKASIFVDAVMHIDQRMEPKDRAFQACCWSLQGIQFVRFMHRDWIKHDASHLPLAIQQHQDFILSPSSQSWIWLFYFTLAFDCFRGLSLRAKLGFVVVIERSKAVSVNIGQQGINRNYKENIYGKFNGLVRWWLITFIPGGSSVFFWLRFFWSCPPTHSSHKNTFVCYELQFQIKVGGTDLCPALIKQQSGAASHTINLTEVRHSYMAQTSCKMKPIEFSLHWYVSTDLFISDYRGVSGMPNIQYAILQ